ASGVAHDLNNALVPALGFTELLLDRPEQLQDTAKVNEFLKLIHTGARDAASVVSRLREFYRQRDQHEVFEPVDLNTIVDEAISLSQPRWKDHAQVKGVTIRVETELGEVPPIAGTESDLREAVTNLIFNAVDAMPESGTLTLRTRSSGSHI